jgi:hypothetical protein
MGIRRPLLGGPVMDWQRARHGGIHAHTILSIPPSSRLPLPRPDPTLSDAASTLQDYCVRTLDGIFTEGAHPKVKARRRCSTQLSVDENFLSGRGAFSADSFSEERVTQVFKGQVRWGLACL